MCSDYSESDDQESKSLDACLLNGNNKIKRAQSAPLDGSDEDSTSNVIKAAIAASNQKLLQENSTSEDEDSDNSDNAMAKSNNKSEKKRRKRIKKSAKSRSDDSDSSDDNGGIDLDNANSSMAKDNIAVSDSSCSNSPVLVLKKSFLQIQGMKRAKVSGSNQIKSKVVRLRKMR